MAETVTDRIARDRRAVISSLWIVVLLNILFRDMHELLRQGSYEQWQALQVTDATLLASGIALSGFISMIVLTRVLPHRGARISNLVVPVVAALGMVTADVHDLDDVWFLAVELVAVAAIVWLAWTWRSADDARADEDGRSPSTSLGEASAAAR